MKITPRTIELSEEEVKEAITYWLENDQGEDIGPSEVTLHAKDLEVNPPRCKVTAVVVVED
jgi:hypothetical protein